MWTCLKLPCSWGSGGHGPDFGTLAVSGHLDRDALRARLRASDALVPVDDFRQVDGIGFRKGGFLPGPEWRPIADTGACGPDGIPPKVYPGSFVALLKIPNDVVQWLSSMENDADAFDAERCARVVRALERHLPDWMTFGGSEVLGYYRNDPGLSSVTFDPNLGLRIGLHLDSWEGSSVAGRRHARSRLLVNLGASPRQLLFMSTPVDVLQGWLGIAEGEGYFVDACFEATAGRTRTVYALEVRPGEAYVAPTECLVHDGSTAMGSSVDICFTMLSFFGLANGAKGSRGPLG